MTFGDCVKELILGEKMRRSGWNGKNMWLRYVPSGYGTVDNNDVPYLPYIEMFTAQGDLVPWLASQTDILANDWEFAT